MILDEDFKATRSLCAFATLVRKAMLNMQRVGNVEVDLKMRRSRSEHSVGNLGRS